MLLRKGQKESDSRWALWTLQTAVAGYTAEKSSQHAKHGETVDINAEAAKKVAAKEARICVEETHHFF